MPYQYRRALMNKAQRIARKIPLSPYCELCPEDEKTRATDRHHPDYRFPEIFVSLCSECHKWIKINHHDYMSL